MAIVWAVSFFENHLNHFATGSVVQSPQGIKIPVLNCNNGTYAEKRGSWRVVILPPMPRVSFASYVVEVLGLDKSNRLLSGAMPRQLANVVADALFIGVEQMDCFVLHFATSLHPMTVLKCFDRQRQQFVALVFGKISLQSDVLD